MWHCRRVGYVDTQESNRPAGISTPDAALAGEFFDVVAALVSVERLDESENALAACDEIAKFANRVKRRHIVLVPFAHLTSELMTEQDEPGRARGLIHEVGERLGHAADAFEVDILSFGWDKEFEIDLKVKGHHGAVAFRSI